MLPLISGSGVSTAATGCRRTLVRRYRGSLFQGPRDQINLIVAGGTAVPAFGDLRQDKRRAPVCRRVISVLSALPDDRIGGLVSELRFAFDIGFVSHSIDAQQHPASHIDRLVVVAADRPTCQQGGQQFVDLG
jgi:hypothetical protein